MQNTLQDSYQVVTARSTLQKGCNKTGRSELLSHDRRISRRLTSRVTLREAEAASETIQGEEAHQASKPQEYPVNAKAYFTSETEASAILAEQPHAGTVDASNSSTKLLERISTLQQEVITLQRQALHLVGASAKCQGVVPTFSSGKLGDIILPEQSAERTNSQSKFHDTILQTPVKSPSSRNGSQCTSKICHCRRCATKTRTSQALFQDPDLVERILHFVQDGRVRASAAAISRTFCKAAQRPTCWLGGLQATAPCERLAAVRAVLQLALHASVPPGPQPPSSYAQVAGAVLQFAARPESAGDISSPDAPGLLVQLVAKDPDRRVRQAALVACALLCRNITALEHLAAQPPLSPLPFGDAASAYEELLVAQRWTRDTDSRFHSLIERSARSRISHSISPLPCPNPGLASLVYALEQHAIALRNPLKAVEDTHGAAEEREYEEAARLASSTAQAEAQRHAIVAVADRQIVRMLALQGVQLPLAFQALRLADGWGYRRVEVLVRVVADSSGMECAAVLRLMLAHGAVSVRDAIVYGADVAGIAHQDDWLGRQQRQV